MERLKKNVQEQKLALDFAIPSPDGFGEGYNDILDTLGLGPQGFEVAILSIRLDNCDDVVLVSWLLNSCLKQLNPNVAVYFQAAKVF
ncbi:hypothetical protein V6N13_090225 [Hibiscus sabdariffa]